MKIDELLDAFLEMINEEERGTGDFEILTNLKEAIERRLENISILTYKDDILVITWGDPFSRSDHVISKNNVSICKHILITGISSDFELDNFIRLYFSYHNMRGEYDNIKVYKVDNKTKSSLELISSLFPNIFYPNREEVDRPRMEIVTECCDILGDILKKSTVTFVKSYF